jgi:drug/metabolite transporter (DMT)-like permease
VLLVVGLALAAAVVHATWNLLLSQAPDTEAATAVALVSGVVLFAPVALLAGTVQSRAVPYLLVSNVLEFTYFAVLARAYDRGQASSIYPVARGSAPVLVLLVSLATGAHIDPAELTGVLLVAAGVVVLSAEPGTARRGLGLGAVAGVCIAAYTLVDKAGLRYADPLPYLSAALTCPALAYLAILVRRKSWAAIRITVRPTSVLAGVGVFAAYGLTLAALSRGAAAPVAAVRETSIVILTALTALVLRQPVRRRQWLGGLVVAAGVVAIATG